MKTISCTLFAALIAFALNAGSNLTAADTAPNTQKAGPKIPISLRSPTASELAETKKRDAAEAEARKKTAAENAAKEKARKELREKTGTDIAEKYLSRRDLVSARADATIQLPKWRLKNRAEIINHARRLAEIITADSETAWNIGKEYAVTIALSPELEPPSDVPELYSVFLGVGFTKSEYVNYVRSQAKTLPVDTAIILLDKEIAGLKSLKELNRHQIVVLESYLTNRAILEELK